MRPIRQLPRDVSSRIAAGEVIENPASVVKELMENSIDAGSSRIDVKLLNGGKGSIAVEDDGYGMPLEELPLAVERFATSKIEEVDDLFRIASFGYRGEALASIGAVSRLEIRSYRAGSVQGGILRVSGGETLIHVPITAQEGTRVLVEDLFFNLPARRSFLKSASSESRKVSALIRDYSAAFPKISFSVQVDGKIFYSTPGGQDRKDVLERIWGRSDEIRDVFRSERGVSINAAWLPSPGTKRRDLTIFFNGRRVKDSIVTAATASCGEGASGSWMFFIDVPANLIDVNIHPGKVEIRVHSTLPLFEIARRAVVDMVNKNSIGPHSLAGSAFCTEKGLDSLRKQGIDMSAEEKTRGLFSRVSQPSFSPPAREYSQKEESTAAFIGQLGSGFLLFHGDDELIIMDPHAAHERILFEKIICRNESGKPQMVSFQDPIPPTLSGRTEEHRKDLEAAGFRFELSSGSVLITAIPEGAGNNGPGSPIELLRYWLNALEGPESSRDLSGKAPDKACKGAVKLGESLSPEEASALLRELLKCRTPFMCPHGRPTQIRLKTRDITTLFGRK